MVGGCGDSTDWPLEPSTRQHDAINNVYAITTSYVINDLHVITTSYVINNLYAITASYGLLEGRRSTVASRWCAVRVRG